MSSYKFKEEGWIMVSTEMTFKTHMLAIPFPLQGHINPMVQFSKLLASRGIKVTFVTSATFSKSILTQNTSIIIESVPDVSDEIESSDMIDAFIKQYKATISRSLPNVIGKMATSGQPVRIIVYDAVMPWVLDLTHRLGLKGASFSTQSSAVCAIFHHFQQGTLKLPLEGPIAPLPSLPPLGLNDLPSFIRDTASSPTLLKVLVSQNINYGKADWILFNSFDKLENEVLNWMAKQWPIKTIGPTIPSKYLENRLEDDNEYGLSLFKLADEKACINWLDSKESGSVVYVSFGSLADLEEEQMLEIFLGLVKSNCNFLWVVRASEESKLPSNFRSETKDKGLIVNWCSQLEVLAHQAVGCFMTHCGWNSTLEALSLGVPMVAMPIWADQRTNAKFIIDVWQVGVRVNYEENEVVTREEVWTCVKEVMQGEKKILLKENALNWKKLANEAINRGSSEKNIEELVLEFYALG